MKGGGRRRYIKEYTNPISNGASQSQSGTTDDSCKSISFDTQLQKPNSETKSLVVNDMLSLIINKGELQVLNSSGKVCGNIVSTRNARIIECMGKGNTYIAVVTANSRSICKVKIQIEL
jgi:hypothetical protein